MLADSSNKTHPFYDERKKHSIHFARLTGSQLVLLSKILFKESQKHRNVNMASKSRNANSGKTSGESQ